MSQLITCPECKKHLQVPDDLMGKKVQCPECKHTFTAVSPDDDNETSSTGTTASPPASTSSKTPAKSAAWDKKSRDDDDEDDDDDGDRDSRPPKKRRSRADDDDDDDLPRRRRRRYGGGGGYAPHRGGLILTFGILAILGFMSIIFGPIAWIMGNGDLEEMRRGRMDPEGEGMTQTGRILGMIATILWLVGLVGGLAFFGCCVCMGLGARGAGGPPGRRR